MKKNWLSGLIFIGFFSALQAQYTTPGTGVTWGLDDLVENSAGTISLEGDEYYINDDLVISVEDTVRITENTIVKFLAGKLITVKGVFQATPSDSIVFTAADTLAPFKSFRFEDSDASILKRCLIEFGGGVDVVNSDLLIEECTFRKNDKSNTTGVIDLFYANPLVLHCSFYFNEGPAILSGANSESSPVIEGNLIYRNNTLNTNMPQINLGTSSPGIAILIKGNTIEGFYNKAGGIAVTTLAGGNLDCVIDSNVIFNNRYGITAYGFDISSIISNNTIYDNNIENLPMQGGSGINFWGGTSNASQVYGNEITGNLWGITVTGDALPNLGQVEPDTLNPGGNRIFNNGNLGIEYDLYNNTPNDIYAENNYWGTYDLDSVEMVIFHYPDDESLGFVDYLPIMDTLVTAVNPVVEKPGVRVYPNPSDSHIRIERPAIFGEDEVLYVMIYDGTGRPAGTYQLRSSNLRLDISAFQSGMYIIDISNGKRSTVSRFVKH